jgi:hypothetical protein
MSERHANLKVRYYPHHGEWMCVVQHLGADGMPIDEVVSATGPTKEDARDRAWVAASDSDVKHALKPEMTA